MRRLVALGERGIPASHGGFETLAEALALYVVRICWDVLVYCEGSERAARFGDDWTAIQHVHTRWPAKARSAPSSSISRRRRRRMMATRLIADPARLSAMRSAARARRQADFTGDAVLAQYEALLTEFAEGAVKR